MAQITHLNPSGMSSNPAFSQGVSVRGPVRTIYVGGQNGVGADGPVVSGQVGDQTARALRNLELVLVEAGAGLADVVTWSISVVQGQSLASGFAAFQQVWGDRPDPPAISFAFVAELANPQFLVEISAIAVVADTDR